MIRENWNQTGNAVLGFISSTKSCGADYYFESNERQLYTMPEMGVGKLE